MVVDKEFIALPHNFNRLILCLKAIRKKEINLHQRKQSSLQKEKNDFNHQMN